jgi:uncharacterized membrane protein
MTKQNQIRCLPIVVVAVSSLILITSTYGFTPSIRGVTSRTQNPININKFISITAASKSNNPMNDEDSNTKTTKNNKSTQPTPIILDTVHNIIGKNNDWKAASLSTSAATIALSTILATSVLLLPTDADAAMSGGRMGGSFSSPSSSSRSMPSSSRSYGGGSGRSSSYYSGGSYNYYSRPSSTIVAPIFVPSPFAPVVPYYGGGAGVISYSRGPSFFDFLVIGGIGFFILNAISQTARSAIDTASESSSFLPWTSSSSTATALGTGSSVVQISVAMNVPNRDDRNSILNVLDRLAETSKTDSRVGVQQLTSQVAIELLRRKSSFTAGYAQAQHFDNTNKGQREYNRMSVQERSKFEKELVSKFSGVDYNRQSAPSRGGATSGINASSTMAVITILLNISGDTTSKGIPTPIRSVKDLERALQRIASDVIIDDCLTSAEILWTPEDRTESLTFRDVVADYPELTNV